MRILLTNDDGVESPGLTLLARKLRQEHEVWVVAPDSDRSGCAHSVTLGAPTRVRRVGRQRYSCSGSPADCVLVAVLGLVPAPIDLLLSGINLGPNLGTDMIYSGTAAAARQGALEGIPSAALSLYGYAEPYDFAGPVRFVAEHVPELLAVWAANTFVNVNFPRGSSYRGVRLTSPCRRVYRDRLDTYETSRGDLYCFLGGELPEAVDDGSTDYAALQQGMVSLSLIEVHPASREPAKGFTARGFSAKKAPRDAETL